MGTAFIGCSLWEDGSIFLEDYVTAPKKRFLYYKTVLESWPRELMLLAIKI